MSARQLDDPAFPTWAAHELAAHRTDPGDLCLEITETSLSDDHKAFVDTLDALAVTGVHIVLD